MFGGDVKSVLEDVVNGGNGEGAKERLTRDRICEVALVAIDEAGLESLSMRALANALGIKASSLYYHFESKDELLTGIAEFLYRTLGRPPTRVDWTDQVKGTFVQLRDFIQAHPNAAPLLVRDLAYSPVAKKRANVLLKLVSRAGLDEGTSASLISNLVALLVGHTYLSLWVREEAGSTNGARRGDELDVTARPLGAATRGDEAADTDTDGSRVWVHKLFPSTLSRSAAGQLTMPLDGGSDDGWWATAGSALPVEEGPGSGVAVYSEAASDLAADAGFLAGLDALIKGFTPD